MPKPYTYLSEKDKHLLDTIRDEMEIEYLNHNLTNPQREGIKASTAVAFSLISKTTLITPEMGLGKTYIAMGIIKEVLQLRPGKKILFCGPNEKLIEFYNDFKHNLPEYRIVYTNASEKGVSDAFYKMRRNADILICGHSVFNKGVDFHINLIPMLDEFSTFILDEGGMMLKSFDSYAYRIMEKFVPNMEYKYILNATPVEKDLQLLINQCRVLGLPIPSRSRIYREYGTITGEHQIIFNDLDQLKNKMKYHMFNVSRSELDIAGDVKFDIDVRFLDLPLMLTKWIREYGVRNLRYPFFEESLFTEEHYPSLAELINVCIKGRGNGDKMLVYVRNVNPKSVMKRALEEMGLKVGIYDGAHTDSPEKKHYVENQFNDGNYDVLLTNRLYGLSLPIANHLIFYDLPPNYFQFVYRAIRNLDSHDIKLTALIYDHPRDFNRMEEEVHSERYQNEFVDRGFTFVSDMMEILRHKRKVGIHDG